MRSGRKLHKGKVCWVPYWTREVIYPSETESCPTSSSSAPWWIMRVPHGGLLPAPTSGGCRCCNPSVFASLWAPHGSLLAGRSTRIWVFHNLPTTAGALTLLAYVGNPLFRKTGRYLSWPRVDPVAEAKGKGVRGQQANRGHRSAKVKSTTRIAFGAD